MKPLSFFRFLIYLLILSKQERYCLGLSRWIIHPQRGHNALSYRDYYRRSYRPWDHRGISFGECHSLVFLSRDSTDWVNGERDELSETRSRVLSMPRSKLIESLKRRGVLWTSSGELIGNVKDRRELEKILFIEIMKEIRGSGSIIDVNNEVDDGGHRKRKKRRKMQISEEKKSSDWDLINNFSKMADQVLDESQEIINNIIYEDDSPPPRPKRRKSRNDYRIYPSPAPKRRKKLKQNEQANVNVNQTSRYVDEGGVRRDVNENRRSMKVPQPTSTTFGERDDATHIKTNQDENVKVGGTPNKVQNTDDKNLQQKRTGEKYTDNSTEEAITKKRQNTEGKDLQQKLKEGEIAVNSRKSINYGRQPRQSSVRRNGPRRRRPDIIFDDSSSNSFSLQEGLFNDTGWENMLIPPWSESMNSFRSGEWTKRMSEYFGMAIGTDTTNYSTKKKRKRAEKDEDSNEEEYEYDKENLLSKIQQKRGKSAAFWEKEGSMLSLILGRTPGIKILKSKNGFGKNMVTHFLQSSVKMIVICLGMLLRWTTCKGAIPQPVVFIGFLSSLIVAAKGRRIATFVVTMVLMRTIAEAIHNLTDDEDKGEKSFEPEDLAERQEQ